MKHIGEPIGELLDRGDLPERIMVLRGLWEHPLRHMADTVLEWDEELKAYTRDDMDKCVHAWVVRLHWGEWFGPTTPSDAGRPPGYVGLCGEQIEMEISHG